ncbi:ClC family H(+)/Cl(-) exchange transporter [Gordonia sp. HY285]|uniref:ClC family H(+)/Cl(-) exchange transporter n=1 Tax=Gordonia liuliyuniae TaxID=2911517 RepID=UPI001F1A9550|nr:ClC family H(+)/Cl(-) exchange transporter [Gordonia liuliyuniae]MCF8610504.1 ClC family H(+)/Cl(-) exchange transporter [Gordonia liuliyuniae]
MPVSKNLSPGLVRLCIVAAVAGVIIGFVGGAFRWCLSHLDRWRVDMLDWADTLPGPGWLIPIGVTAAGAVIAAMIVHVMPLASGSGIQHVEAVQRGEADPPPLLLLPAKFVGGLIAIGAGLVLGREGPTVHMGAAVGAAAARKGGLDDDDVRQMQTSVGGAGLAVAFNAPIGGALFVLEEVAKSVRMRIVVPTLIAVAVAVACARLVIGDGSDFHVGTVDTPSIVLLPVFIVFGLITGAMGGVYNRVILGALDLVARFSHVPAVVKAGIAGAIIGALLVIDPLTAGGGDTVAQKVLDGGGLALPLVAALFLIRFVAGPLSYAAATPGGLFAPLLAVGALWGMLFAALTDVVLPGQQPSLTVAMAIVGMSALFGAVVRAPVTGVVLVMEMTATTTVTVPMLAATAAAVLVAQLVGSPPIYDSLRERMLASAVPSPTTAASTDDDGPEPDRNT